MEILFDEYGFMFDTEWAYVSLSWELLISAGVIATAYLLFKKWNNRK